MKVVFVVMMEDIDYRWDGENSVPVRTRYPGLVFESREDAEKYGCSEIFEVNCYAPGETP